MGRQAQGAVKDIVVGVRLPRHLVLKMEQRRGHLSRSEWVRALIVRELGR